jgi:hypothetical protein
MPSASRPAAALRRKNLVTAWLLLGAVFALAGVIFAWHFIHPQAQGAADGQAQTSAY